MAFVVEDGTGVANANAYATVEFVDSYFSERNIVTWSGTTALKQAWIIQATDYINNRFGRRFKGEQEFPETQLMPFPRTGDPATEGMPASLLKATAEYANRARNGLLAPDPVVDNSGLTITSKRKKVGPLETEYQYAQSGAGSQPSMFKPYPSADMLIAPMLRRTAGVIRN